jgi:hypothetical protein
MEDLIVILRELVRPLEQRSLFRGHRIKS